MIEYYNGDCMEGMKRYKDKHFDLAIVDPPYGIERFKKGGSHVNKYGTENQEWNNIKPTKEYFNELFRVSKYPGTKNGNDTEFNNFIKNHKDWRDILPLLIERLDYQKEARQVRKENKLFTPEWKNLQTWINQRSWEMIINTNE